MSDSDANDTKSGSSGESDEDEGTHPSEYESSDTDSPENGSNTSESESSKSDSETKSGSDSSNSKSKDDSSAKGSKTDTIDKKSKEETSGKSKSDSSEKDSKTDSSEEKSTDDSSEKETKKDSSKTKSKDFSSDTKSSSSSEESKTDSSAKKSKNDSSLKDSETKSPDKKSKTVSSTKKSKDDSSDKKSKEDPNSVKSPSLKSIGMDSSLSTTTSETQRRPEQQLSHRLTPEGGAPPGEVTYDYIAFLIYCPVHQRIALNKTDKAVWLPFVAMSSSMKYQTSAVEGISIVLSRGHKELDARLQKKPPILENSLALLTTLQMPDQRTIIRLIQIVKLDKSKDDFKCCQNSKRIHWWPKKEVLSGNIEKIWGPEVNQMAKYIDNKAKNKRPTLEEYTVDDAIEFVANEDDDRCPAKMLRSLKISQKDVEIFYIYFIEHCFPSLSMSLDSFKIFMSNYGYKAKDPQLIRIFNAFILKDNHFLCFQELLLGLAAMEPNCPHTEFRIGFLFRYYDFDGDRNLNEEEMRKMLTDLNEGKDKTENKAKEIINSYGKDGKMTFEEFSKALVSQGFTDTTNLCRSSKPILPEVTKLMSSDTSDKSSTESTKSSKSEKSKKNKGICYKCRTKKYDYGLHSVKLNTTGRCAEPRRIFEPHKVGDGISDRNRFSMEFKFNSKSVPSVFIDLIRDPKNRKKIDEKGFLTDDKDLLLKYLKNLCTDVTYILESEERLMKLNSPMIVIGDIGGKLSDLIQMERILWKSFPIVSSNYLFLGNFTDDGPNGIECVIYVLAMKLIAPNKVFLLRGSQEVREIQEQNRFKKECHKKYGKDIGDKVLNLINDVFDKLPIAVIVDELIFCANGGIPYKSTKLEDISSLPIDLKDPKTKPIAFEVLNNEPLVDESSVALKKGFAPNKSREKAYWFGKEAIDNFVTKNGLTHLIRSNNVYDSKGYAFHFGGKCLTVFSNSNSKHKNNLSTVMLDKQKIQLLKIVTKEEDKEVSEKSKSF